MRILYLSQLIPYPVDAGPKVRIYHNLQYLAKAGHEIIFVAFRREGDHEEGPAELRPYCSQIHTVLMRRSKIRDALHLMRSLLSGRPFLITRDGVREMYETISSLMKGQAFDAIHADQLWMAQYALAARREVSSNGQLMTVLDQHNAVHLIPERLASQTTNPLKRLFLGLEARKMAHYELQTCSAFDRVVWVTEEDRQAIATLPGGKELVENDPVIPICVDPQGKDVIRRTARPARVTFLGGMHWPPNAEGVSWFVQQVWPLVHQKVPEAILTVIGKAPPAFGNSAPIQNIEVTGYVDDPEPYLAETAAFVVPLHAGGGMRVKIVDAWSWGMPIVSTRIGAEGVRTIDGRNLLIADRPNAFAYAVISLLREPELATCLAAAGRETAESLYDWRTIYGAWDEIYPVAERVGG
jgi:glycosyltransferase involved in cell wall biosynthesis